MACRLTGTKPLPEPIMAHCKLDHWQQILVAFESKYNNNAFKEINIKMVAILSRPQFLQYWMCEKVVAPDLAVQQQQVITGRLV